MLLFSRISPTDQNGFPSSRFGKNFFFLFRRFVFTNTQYRKYSITCRHRILSFFNELDSRRIISSFFKKKKIKQRSLANLGPKLIRSEKGIPRSPKLNFSGKNIPGISYSFCTLVPRGYGPWQFSSRLSNHTGNA